MPLGDHGPGHLAGQALLDQTVQGVAAQAAGVAGDELLEDFRDRDAPGPAQMAVDHQSGHGLDGVLPDLFREKRSVDDAQAQVAAGLGQGDPLPQGLGAKWAGRCNVETDFHRQRHAHQPFLLVRWNGGAGFVGGLQRIDQTGQFVSLRKGVKADPCLGFHPGSLRVAAYLRYQIDFGKGFLQRAAVGLKPVTEIMPGQHKAQPRVGR